MFSTHVVPLPVLQYSKMLFDVALLNRFSERNRWTTAWENFFFSLISQAHILNSIQIWGKLRFYCSF